MYAKSPIIIYYASCTLKSISYKAFFRNINKDNSVLRAINITYIIVPPA